jgi:hypothetical protein
MFCPFYTQVFLNQHLDAEKPSLFVDRCRDSLTNCGYLLRPMLHQNAVNFVFSTVDLASSLKTGGAILTKLAIFLTLFVSVGVSQAAKDPPASQMVSPASASAVSIQPAIEPGESAISEIDSGISIDPASLFPELPAVPRKNATLVGGTLEKLDRVRDQVTVRVFGGGRTTVLFDTRTRVFRGTKEGTIADLREGQRIYLDTILDGSTIFAKNIRLDAASALGESRGVIVKYRADQSELSIRDGIAPIPVNVRLNSSTQFVQGDRTVPASTLVSGALVDVIFTSQGNGHDTAQKISILALPGTRYVFSGQVVHIDLRTGLLVLNSSTDHKTYEIYLDPSFPPDDNLQPGSMVTAVTNFQDSRYVTRNLTVQPQK